MITFLSLAFHQINFKTKPGIQRASNFKIISQGPLTLKQKLTRRFLEWNGEYHHRRKHYPEMPWFQVSRTLHYITPLSSLYLTFFGWKQNKGTVLTGFDCTIVVDRGYARDFINSDGQFMSTRVCKDTKRPKVNVTTSHVTTYKRDANTCRHSH